MARILICDDAAFIRVALTKIIEGAGHIAIAQAATGKECIDRYLEYKPDIVLMDITMPDMDGITATKNIVSIDKNATIIIVSALGQQLKVFEAISAGAKDFIVKPFEAERIISCIAKYI
jgi:two-component system chemotaxis response regulator CheY